MNTVEHKETFYIETSRPRFKISAINGCVTDFEIYSSSKGDYTDLLDLSKDELQDSILIVVSEYLKLDCSSILNR